MKHRDVDLKKLPTTIGIIGLGYVGLPLAVEFLKSGARVIGFDVEEKKVQALLKGKSHISDVPAEVFRPYLKKAFFPTTKTAPLARAEALIICVPTPLRKSKDPDISYILNAADRIKSILRRGQLIVLESTTYPGTTREVILPILEETGLKAGKDFNLAFSPERVDPGNKKYGVKNTPKIVGGLTKTCSDRAAALYASIVNQVVSVSSPESAEMTKLLENTFRAVNIGLVNEVALMCNKMKIDVWEVIDAAATKPFGFMPFYPGPGLGGHCIPLDPHYLSWKLKTLNFYARFIELAGEINSKMPSYVVERVSAALNEHGKAVKGAKIIVMGVSYKKDVTDIRESPALDVIGELIQRGAKVQYHDPYVPRLTLGNRHLSSTPLSRRTIKEADCVIITTHHSVFNLADVAKDARILFDTRNATSGLANRSIRKL